MPSSSPTKYFSVWSSSSSSEEGKVTNTSTPSSFSLLKLEHQKLKNSLQCPVCLETFQRPTKILPCLHSFCSRCLDQHVLSSSSSSSSSSQADQNGFCTPPQRRRSQLSGQTQTQNESDTEDSSNETSLSPSNPFFQSSSSSSSSLSLPSFLPPPRSRFRSDQQFPCPVCRQTFSLPDPNENSKKSREKTSSPSTHPSPRMLDDDEEIIEEEGHPTDDIDQAILSSLSSEKKTKPRVPQEDHLTHFKLDRLDLLKDQLKNLSGIDSSSSSSSSFDLEKCDQCDLSDPSSRDDPSKDASTHCLDCHKNLCENHTTQDIASHSCHSLIDICDLPDHLLSFKEDLHPPPSSSTSNPVIDQAFPCPLHHSNSSNPHQQCVDCGSPFCSPCSTGEDTHTQTQTSRSSNLFSRHCQSCLESKTSSLIDLVSSRLEDIETSLALVDQMESILQETTLSHKDKVVDSLDSLKLKIVQQIEDHKVRLLNDLDQKTHDKMEKLRQQRKQLERDQVCLEDSVNFSRSFLSDPHSISSFKLHFELMTDQLTRLKEDWKLLRLPVETRCLQLCEIQDQDQLDLSEALINNFSIVEQQTQEIKKSLRFFENHQRIRRRITTPVRDLNSIGSAKLIIQPNQSNQRLKFNIVQEVTVDKLNNIIVSDTKENLIHIFDQEGSLIRSFGERGSAKGQLTSPQGMAIDHFNNIVVCDFGNNRIQIFDHQGKSLHSFGSGGTGDGQFRGLCGVAVDQLNRIITCDTGNNRIQIFDHQGNHLQSIGSLGKTDGQFDRPFGVAVDQLNRIIVSDTYNHRIQIFDDQGKHLLTIGSRGRTDEHFVLPFKAVADLHNNIIVCDSSNHKIQIFDEQGHHLKTFGSKGSADNQFLLPSAISINQSNNIVVCDMRNHRVMCF